MRRFWIVAAILVLASLPQASAHGDEGHLGHLSVKVGTVGPGNSTQFELSFEDGPLAAGWVFFVYGGLAGEAPPLNMTLLGPEGIARQWDLTAGDFELYTTLLPWDGFYSLNLTNPNATESVQYAIYFDQSCNCLNKSIGLPKGWALFNFDVPAERRLGVDIEVGKWDPTVGLPGKDDSVRVTGHVALRTGQGAQWPDDFTIVQSASNLGDHLKLEVETEEAARYYIMVQAVEGAEPSAAVFLDPDLELEALDGGQSPAPAPLLVVLVLAAAAAVLRRTR